MNCVIKINITCFFLLLCAATRKFYISYMASLTFLPNSTSSLATSVSFLPQRGGRREGGLRYVLVGDGGEVSLTLCQGPGKVDQQPQRC